MTTSDTVTNKLLSLLADLGKQHEAIRREMEVRLADIDLQIDAITTTMQLLQERGDLDMSSVKIRPTTDELAKSKTQKEALRKIAQTGDGTVNATVAANLLIEARLAKGNRRNVGPHLYATMKNSDEWAWVSPGTFKLVDGHKREQPELIEVG